MITSVKPGQTYPIDVKFTNNSTRAGISASADAYMALYLNGSLSSNNLRRLIVDPGSWSILTFNLAIPDNITGTTAQIIARIVVNGREA